MSIPGQTLGCWVLTLKSVLMNWQVLIDTSTELHSCLIKYSLGWTRDEISKLTTRFLSTQEEQNWVCLFANLEFRDKTKTKSENIFSTRDFSWKKIFVEAPEGVNQTLEKTNIDLEPSEEVVSHFFFVKPGGGGGGFIMWKGHICVSWWIGQFKKDFQTDLEKRSLVINLRFAPSHPF